MKKLTLSVISFLLFYFISPAQVTWQNASTKGMGYVDGIYINPTSNYKYVRTDVAGMFRFDDAAQKWISLTDKLVTLLQSGIANVESFAFDNSTSGDKQVIYALCGNGKGSFMIKSINNGATWSINRGWNNTTINADGNGEWRCSGEKIAVDPNNSSVVYCGTRYDGLWNTTNAASQWNSVNSFTRIGGSGGLNTQGGISFVVFDPSSTINNNGQSVSKNIYVGLIDDGIYRSNDGGNSWAYMNNGFDTTKYNPVRAVFNNNRLIVATMRDSEIGDGQIWQYTPDANTNSGTWVDKTPGLANGFVCPVYGHYAFNAVTIMPGTTNTVYLAIRGNTPHKIFYTQNFDAALPNWKILTMDDNSGYSGACAAQYQPSVYTTPPTWINAQGYDWVGDVSFEKIANNKLWITSGNGVMNVADVTASPAIITAVNEMQGLEMLCVNDMVAPPAPNTSALVTASMDVLGIHYADLNTGNATKLDNTLNIGAGINIDYSFKNPNTLVLIGQDYSNPVHINRIIKSTNGGIDWKSIYTTAASCSDAAWGGNIAISSVNVNNIIWVPQSISYDGACTPNAIKNYPRYTLDGGSSWQPCTDINLSDGNFVMLQGGVYAVGKSLESDKVNGNKFYYYALPGYTFITQLWRTSNGGANWVLMSTGKMPVTGSGQLKANPFVEDDIWFSPFNGYIRDNDLSPASRQLYHSTDGGASWNPLTSIDEVYAFGFGAKPSGFNNAQLFVYGKKNNVESIYVSNDLGSSFTDAGNQNLPEGIITNIAGDMKTPGRFYAATGCRGVWYADVSSVVLPLSIISFTGQRKENTNILNWVIAPDPNGAKMIVQYSIDGVNFTDIAQLPFISNSSYNHVTNNSVSFYRIKFVYINGDIKFTNIIKITNGGSNNAYVYPNPAGNNATLYFFGANLIGTQAKVFSANGILVAAITLTNNNTNINLRNYQLGCIL